MRTSSRRLVGRLGALALAAALSASLLGCGDLPAREAAAPPAAVPISTGPMSTGPMSTGSAGVSAADIDLAAAQVALEHDPAVAAAIGPAFAVLRRGPAGPSEAPDHVAFVVKTPQPVSAAPGTWRWPVDAYGRPVIEPPASSSASTARTNPPLSYYQVVLRLDLSLESIIPVLADVAEPGVGPPPPAGTMPTPPTMPAGRVAAGEAALRADPAVATAIGRDYEVLAAGPIGTYADPIGIAFLVRTPHPVTMPAGTLTTKGTGEGGPTIIEPSPHPLGPVSYVWVQLDDSNAVTCFLGVPDELGAHEAETAAG